MNQTNMEAWKCRAACIGKKGNYGRKEMMKTE